MSLDATFGLQVLQIIWINLLLSGDNAVVIALACRSLTPQQRKWGVILGAGAAVALRIAFTLIVVQLMEIPYLKLVGGVLLLWIAVKLLIDETDETDIKDSHTIRSAIQTIVVADLVMSLDNVVAIAAAAKGSMALIVLGLLMSVPLIVYGATFIITILHKYPALVWAGAALLGWVAGQLMASDPAARTIFGTVPPSVEHFVAPAVAALLVVAVAWLILLRTGENKR